jgi:hypothetical protein
VGGAAEDDEVDTGFRFHESSEESPSWP